MEDKFNSKWNVWYHHTKDDWKIDGYRNIYTIDNVKNYWKLFNNWDELGGVSGKHYFIMKEGVTPIWEDENNRNGGCWSFKVEDNDSQNIWNDLSLYLVTESISKIKDDILGISICLKKNNNSIVKIWNKNSNNNDNELLSNDILEKWGSNVIYIAHMPN